MSKSERKLIRCDQCDWIDTRDGAPDIDALAGQSRRCPQCGLDELEDRTLARWMLPIRIPAPARGEEGNRPDEIIASRALRAAVYLEGMCRWEKTREGYVFWQGVYDRLVELAATGVADEAGGASADRAAPRSTAPAWDAVASA